MSNDPESDPFPRQPGPIIVTFAAEDQRDIDRYIAVVVNKFERNSYDTITRSGNTLTIHPRAVND